MASIKVKFRPSTVADHEGTIYYQIIHERMVRQLNTCYKIFPDEWDESRSMVALSSNRERRSMILSVREQIRFDIDRLNRIEKKLIATMCDYTSDDLVEEFNRYTQENTLYNYMEGIIARLKLTGKIRTSETYRSALCSFMNFREDEDIMLDSITSDVMESYEGWLRRRQVSSNTVSFYIRIIRAVYNRAVEQDIIENNNPFRHVYTGVDKTVKRALPIPALKKIKALNLTANPPLEYARDMFLLSFYLRGMSFIDMAFLKKTDLKNGFVSYRRRKTGQLLIIEWTKEMQTLLAKYPENKTCYSCQSLRIRAGMRGMCI